MPRHGTASAIPLRLWLRGKRASTASRKEKHLSIVLCHTIIPSMESSYANGTVCYFGCGLRSSKSEERKMNIPTQMAAVLLGLLGGALLLIAMGLVPYWQSLDPTEFTELFRENSPIIAGIMMPLGFTAAGLTWLATGLAVWKKLPSRYWLIAAFGLRIVYAHHVSHLLQGNKCCTCRKLYDRARNCG